MSSFVGIGPTTVDASTLTGSTLASGVTASSLTSVGTLTSGVWNAGAVTSSGNLTLTGNPSTYGQEFTGSNGGGIAATHASGTLRFYSGGATERMRLDINGILTTGGTGTGVSGASGGDIVIPNSRYYRSNNSSSVSARRMIGLDSNNDVLIAEQDINNVYFYANSATARMTIASTGFLGIGTTSPSSPLHLSGTGGGAYLANLTNAGLYGLYVKTTGTTTSHQALWVEDNSNRIFSVMATGEGYFRTSLGIGTTTPATPLHVSGSSVIATIAGTTTESYLKFTNTGAGSSNGFQVQTTSNDVYLDNYNNGNIYIYTNNTERMRITSSGVQVSGVIKGNFSGSSYNYASVSAFSNGEVSYFSSDRRLKTNIQPITSADGLMVTRQLQPSTFNLIEDGFAASGFIAQDVEHLVPGAATRVPNDGMLAFNVTGVVAYAVGAIQELDAQVQTLTARLAALEAGD